MIAATASSTPAGYPSTLVVDPDGDSDRRWTAWRARGLAHERAINPKLLTVALLATPIATAAAIADSVLSP